MLAKYWKERCELAEKVLLGRTTVFKIEDKETFKSFNEWEDFRQNTVICDDVNDKGLKERPRVELWMEKVDLDKSIEVWEKHVAEMTSLKEIQGRNYYAVKGRGLITVTMDRRQFLDKMMEELIELEDAINNESLERVGEEMADCIVVYLLFAKYYNIDVPKCLLEVTEKNEARAKKVKEGKSKRKQKTTEFVDFGLDGGYPYAYPNVSCLVKEKIEKEGKSK